MTTIVKWHNDDYDLNCDINELTKFGFVNSTYHHDLAPSFELEGKLKVFFINTELDEMKREGSHYKFILNRINDDELEHIHSTNSFNILKTLIKKEIKTVINAKGKQ